MKKNILPWLIFLATVSFGQGKGSLRLSSLFSDHMVLQQQMQIPVWGTARPLSTVQVVLAGFTATTIASQEGEWMVRLPSMNAGGPYVLHVLGDGEAHIHDVMIGEVWVASGQSNMEWTLGNGIGPDTQKEINEANYPDIRYFVVPKEPFSIPRKNLTKGSWRQCTPAQVRDFSAVGYAFARELWKNTNVAVGVICSYWGATKIESWMSADMLRSHPQYTRMVERTDTDTNNWNRLVRESIRNEYLRDSIANAANEGIRARVHLKDYPDTAWKTCTYPMNMPNMDLTNYWGFVWLRKKFFLPAEYEKTDFIIRFPVVCRNYEIYLNGNPVFFEEDEITKSRIYTIRGEQFNRPDNVLAIRMTVYWGYGAIGQQGVEPLLVSRDGKKTIALTGKWHYHAGIEPPVPQRQDYNSRINVLFNGMIAPLMPYGIRGVIWYQGEQNTSNARAYRNLFPMLINDWRIRWQQGYFPFLYVQLANYYPRKENPSEDVWAELREAQMMTLSQPNTGMAVAIDLGEANDIHPKQKIPVGQRLFLAAQKIAYGKELVHSGPIYDSMYIKGNTIRIRFTSVGSGLVSKDNKPLKSFAIAGADMVFQWADAVIINNEVVVSSPLVPDPVAVRYAWESNPDATLYNREGLPASPFRTDYMKK